MKEVIYSKYSNERDDKFKIKTLILQDENECKFVEKHALTLEANAHIQYIVECEKLLANAMKNTKFQVNKSTYFDNYIELEYLNGKTLANIIENEIANKNYDKVIALIEEYTCELNTMATKRFNISKEFESVFGSVNFQKELYSCDITDIDLIFANIVVENEKWHVIDYEWTFNFPIPVNYVLFRAIKYSGNTRDVIDEALVNKLNIFNLLQIDAQEIEQYEKMECNFQKYVKGKITPLGHLLTTKRDTLSDCISSVQNDRMELFFDEGQGFKAEKKETFELKNNEINNYKFNLSSDVKSLRIDPGDTCALVDLICISLNGTTLDKAQYIHNGINIDENKILFVTEDPQIVIGNLPNENIDVEISLKVEKLTKETAKLFLSTFESVKKMDERVIAKLEALDNAAQAYEVLKEEQIKKEKEYKQQIDELNVRLHDKEEECRNQIDQLNKEKDSLNIDYDMLIAERDTLKSELSQLQYDYSVILNQSEEARGQVIQLQGMYDSIANSTCWKLTKPIRTILDAIKALLKSNRYTHLFYKGLQSLKNNGFKYTMEKVKMRNFARTTIEYVQPNMDEIKAIEKTVSNEIKFSIIVPLYNTQETYLREMILSVMGQTYQNWELCLADGSDRRHDYVEKIVLEYQAIDSRIKYQRLDENKGISENSNACVGMATGDYIALLDHDDLLAADALFANAWAIEETAADILYSDEDHLSMAGEYVNPFFKPDWSPDLLYSQMYICHFLVIKKSLFDAIGGFRAAFDGSQDYDLMLRLSEQTDRICHIPMILYHWRECEGSTAANADAKPYAHIAGKNALDEHLKRKYGNNAYAADGEHTFTYEARFDIQQAPLVSIIIPMKDKHELTDACIKSILDKTIYQNYEIIILDNRSEQPETTNWFYDVQQLDNRIKVFTADMDFNWSALNNYGISKANGEVFVFLNNDTLVISNDWLDRLVENAMRDDIGVVGAMLLYEDNTIQHAGVVVGIGGWADHIFKGMTPVHYGSPFVSSVLSRNVLAVTGACMAISRKTIEQIGGFDESFIICGSDVEICVRAYENGLFNKYDANVKLYHLESKSRDSYIPEVDFQRSYECYTPYRENVDPFFNINLDNTSVIPKGRIISMDLINFKNFIKRCPITASLYQKAKESIVMAQNYDIPEIGPVHARIDEIFNGQYRLNLLVPSVDEKHVFGGISTAMKFFENLRTHCDCPARIITLDAPVDLKTSTASKEYVLINSEDTSTERLQLVAFSDRYQKTIPVAKNDIFMATGWWTAYVINDVLNWQKDTYGGNINPIIYFIQDYEPGFYPWSSRYLLADSTYRLDTPTLAVVNSSILAEYFDRNEYTFTNKWAFDPVLNDNLKQILLSSPDVVEKKKQIIVYGRPSVDRNAFSLLIAALKVWIQKQPNAHEWVIYSAGENHADIDLGNGMHIQSVGKLSLEEYAKLMLETYAGVSLMVSPHPSYPPLEMATFGVKVITNCYANKDLSMFSDNIVSLVSASPENIAQSLCNLCNQYNGEGTLQKEGHYITESRPFANIIEELTGDLLKKIEL